MRGTEILIIIAQTFLCVVVTKMIGDYTRTPNNRYSYAAAIGAASGGIVAMWLFLIFGFML